MRKKSCGVTIRNPVLAATSSVKCSVFAVTNQSGRALIAVTSTGTSFPWRMRWRCASNSSRLIRGVRSGASGLRAKP